MDGLMVIVSATAIDSTSVMDANWRWTVDGATAIRWQWTMQEQLNGDKRWMAMDGNGRCDGDLTVLDLTVMGGVMVTGGQQWTD